MAARKAFETLTDDAALACAHHIAPICKCLQDGRFPDQGSDLCTGLRQNADWKRKGVVLTAIPLGKHLAKKSGRGLPTEYFRVSVMRATSTIVYNKPASERSTTSILYQNSLLGQKMPPEQL